MAVNMVDVMLALSLAKGYANSAIEGTVGPLHGLSAYEIAVSNGYSGTESQWLQTLYAKVDSSTKTWTIYDVVTNTYVDTGIDSSGLEGKSAYESAQEAGFTGTEGDFYSALLILSSIKTSGSATNFLNEQGKYVSVGIMQPPFIEDYSGSNSFVLPKTPDIIMDVMILSGTSTFYYLQDGDYSLAGKTIRINNPVMTTGMRLKVNYVSKEV